MAKIKTTKVSFSPRQAAAFASKLAKADAINTYISANKKQFAQNSTFTAAWLDVNLAWLVPELAAGLHIQAHCLKRVAAYTTLNKALAERGLYIKASNYYSIFTVLPMADTLTRVTAYAKTSSTQDLAGKCLDRNIAKYQSHWRKLGVKQIDRLIAKL